jgi:hypothetical protein
MKSSRFSLLFLALCWLLTLAVPVHTQTTASSSMVVKQTTPKPVWVKAEVIHADANSMIVRERASERAIHTFTYDAKIKAKMKSIAAKGGFQSGDKVQILCIPGQTVALKVKGKPSKAP